MKRKEFVNYLRKTLIPDLRESGRDATADDFEAACEFILNPDLKEVNHPNWEDGEPSDLSLYEKGE